MMPKNLNITNGSRTIWVSSDGRQTPVYDMAIPHLINAVEKLYRNYFTENMNNTVFLTEADAYKYLMEYCPTFLVMQERLKRIKLPGILVVGSYGRPSNAALAFAQKANEPKPVPQKFVFEGDTIDQIAELVAIKLKSKSKSRKPVAKKRR